MLKPREIVVAGATPNRGAACATGDCRSGCRSRRSTAGRSIANRRAERCSINCASAGSKDSASSGQPAAVAAAGALVHYLRSTQKVDLAHVRAIAYRQRADALLIDPTTLKHLEIVEGSEGGRDGSLLDELDRTVTSIGSRLLRAWLLRPLVSLEPIRDRLDAVEELAFRTTERGKFRDTIKAVQDLERLVARAALGTAGPRDLVGLKQSLAVVPRVRDGARRAARRRSCGRCSPSSTIWPTSGRGSRRRCSTIRPRSRATAASRATASTPSSTSFATISRSGKQVIARDGRARAGADRHQRR